MQGSYPHRAKALRVEQPLGVYYVATIPARILLDVAFSDRMRAAFDDEREGYDVDGTQRGPKSGRAGEIAAYIDRDDSAFPNSIILAANYEPETGTIRSEDADEAESGPVWRVEALDDGCFELVIPTREKLAAIIDGQHRLDGFRQVSKPRRLDMALVCSVFMDLPKPFQAQLFATINSTQKQVDKSLTYELFGYNITDEPPESWTPDKLAVFLTRRLNTQAGSPLEGHILVAPKRDRALEALNKSADWHVSTATVVEGILRLISSNPKRDTNAIMSSSAKNRRVLAGGRNDRSPLREQYINGQDKLLFAIVLNYLTACDELFWKRATAGSFILKTVGVQALFDVLRLLAPSILRTNQATVEFFTEALEPASKIDFSAIEFQNASGSGRSYIRRRILEATGIA